MKQKSLCVCVRACEQKKCVFNLCVCIESIAVIQNYLLDVHLEIKQMVKVVLIEHYSLTSIK